MMKFRVNESEMINGFKNNKSCNKMSMKTDERRRGNETS